jgi:hypothetical protein
MDYVRRRRRRQLRDPGAMPRAHRGLESVAHLNRHDFALERRQALEKTAKRILQAAGGQKAPVVLHTRSTAGVTQKKMVGVG